MRAAIWTFVVVPLCCYGAGADDALSAAGRLADSDAPELALARVESEQPKLDDKRWPEWEELRINLLSRLGRSQSLLERVDRMPASVPPNLMRTALFQGARASLELSRGAQARRFLARLLWQTNLSDEEFLTARLLTIRSYIADPNPEQAYYAMLRFQQDFHPLDKETAALFVAAQLASGMDKEAVTWLSAVDEASPLKLLLRLKSGLITADAAIASARAGLGQNPDYWLAIAEAAKLQENVGLYIEAREQLLNAQQIRHSNVLVLHGDELWRDYAAGAQLLGNQNQLLVGDDRAWFDLGNRLAQSNRPAARAIFAYLASGANAQSISSEAQDKLAASLLLQNLGNTALALYGEGKAVPLDRLNADTRYTLGAYAAKQNKYALAAHIWRGMKSPPAGLVADEWMLQQAAVFARGGAVSDAAAALQAALADRERLVPGVAPRFLEPVQDIFDAGQPLVAEKLLSILLGATEPAERREVLFMLGKCAESRNDFSLAADDYLQAATLIQEKSQDALALTARMQSAASLMRAGFRSDARTQYEWLLKTVKDGAQLETVRRALTKLN